MRLTNPFTSMPVRRRIMGMVAVPTMLLAASMAFANVTPAAASVTGTVVFQGTATLPTFPCANCGGGTLIGTATGTVTGVTAIGVPPSPYVAVFANAPLNASFTYQEVCPAALPVPPATGTAQGTFNVTGGVAEGGITGTATLSGSFSWTRVGTVAVIVTAGTTVTGSGGGTAAGLVADVGVAVFAPIPPVGTCAAPVSNQTARVAGIDTEAA